MTARSAESVVEHLQSRALFVVMVADKITLAGGLYRARTVISLSRAPLLIFYRSLATMLHAGIPLTRSLIISIAETSHVGFRETLRSVLARVESGSAFGDALRPHSSVFKPLYVAMIEAGEAGGVLDDVLGRVVSLLERERAVYKRLSSALAYPLFVVLTTCALTVLLVTTTVPSFARMFEQLNVPLPPQTEAVLALGRSLQRPWNIGIAVSFASVLSILGAGFAKRPRVRRAVDGITLRLPIYGPLTRKATTAKICATLASLLRSGVTLLSATDIVGPISANASYRDALENIHAALREGESFAALLGRSRLFDTLTLHLVAVGEETGSLDSMLLAVANYHDADVEQAIASIGALLEPVLMLAVGLIVGAVVFSIYVPLYTMISQVH